LKVAAKIRKITHGKNALARRGQDYP